MTQVWLPLLPPSGPPPTSVQVGWQLQTSLCNNSDSTQQLAWHNNGTVTHAASGLCLAQGPSIPDLDVNIYADICRSSATGQPIANQTWYKTGVAFSNTSFGFGNGCSNWNAGNGFALGAPIMLYRCGNQTQVSLGKNTCRFTFGTLHLHSLSPLLTFSSFLFFFVFFSFFSLSSFFPSGIQDMTHHLNQTLLDFFKELQTFLLQVIV
jgi:hypothetical protein